MAADKTRSSESLKRGTFSWSFLLFGIGNICRCRSRRRARSRRARPRNDFQRIEIQLPPSQVDLELPRRVAKCRFDLRLELRLLKLELAILLLNVLLLQQDLVLLILQ